MLIPEALNNENRVYLNSLSVDELSQAVQNLRELLSAYRLTENNQANAEALLLRVQAKKLAFVYFNDGYEEEDYAALEAYLRKAWPIAEEHAHTKTAALLKRLLEVSEAVHAITVDAAAWAAKVRSYDGETVAVSAQECQAVAETFDAKIALAQALEEFDPLFGSNVAFLNVKSDLVGALTKERDRARAAEKKLALADVHKFMADNVTEIEDLERLQRCDYYPQQGAYWKNTAGANILCTPFEDEALLLAVKNCPSVPKIVRAGAFAEKDEAALEKIFGYLLENGTCVVVLGLDRYRAENKAALLKQSMAFGKRGGKLYIVDKTGTRTLYEEALALTGGALTALDISFTYLMMPVYADVIEYLKEKTMIGDGSEDRAFVKENLPFLGFVGIGRAVAQFTAGRNWRQFGVQYGLERRREAIEYLKQLPSQGQLIDANWGDFSSVVVNKALGKKEFDYDGITGVRVENIQKIMEGDFSLFAKCGLLSIYCTMHGDDSSRWQELDPEEQSERATLATRMVMRALGCHAQPVVEILEELSNKNAGGLCCDGGTRIQYKKDSVQNYNWFVDCICHECFHAFQAMAENSAWEDWYWTELGVTKGRITEWRYNDGCYVNLTPKSKTNYMIQIIESDARAFAADSISQAGKVWHEVHFE